MHIDMPAVLLGVATMTALVSVFAVLFVLLSTDGPWEPKLNLAFSSLSAICAMLMAVYLIASYILPEDSSVYDQLIAQRPMYGVLGIAAAVLAVVLWKMAMRWRSPQQAD